MARTAILMTCFNRKEKTKRCLQTLEAAKNPGFSVFLVDDGCTDGTAEMVKEEFPYENVLHSGGNLYWNQGMRLAFQEAVKQKYDFYLWVNDDVVFEKNILTRILATYHQAVKEKETSQIVVVGYTLDEKGEAVTYGGYRLKKGIIPIKLEMVKPSTALEECDTCNGNCVLIPKEVVDVVGINCEVYQHSQGDIDYGLSSKKAGCKLVLTNYPVGYCEKNEGARIWNDIHYKASVKEKRRVMDGVRHRPRNEWKYFTKKFGGSRWFLRYYLPYAKLYVSALITKFER